MLTITPTAEDWIATTGINPIRFGARPNKGCAGYEYIWERGTYIEGRDYQLNINDRFTILVGVNHKRYVDCCEIDLKTQDDGLLTKVEFKNEKTKVVCGCGESLDFEENIADNPDEIWAMGRMINYRSFGPHNDPWKKVEPNEDGDLVVRPSIEVVKPELLQRDTVKEVTPNTLTNKYKNWRKV